MPAKSQAQAKLFRAAAHGATFPKAQALRKDMTLKDLMHFTHMTPKAKAKRA